jgi:hypothetical protein
MVLAVSKSIGYPTTPSELVSASLRGSIELDDANFRRMLIFFEEGRNDEYDNDIVVEEAGTGSGSES